jgi:hypothetical protein
MIRPNQPPRPIEPGQRNQPRPRKLTRLAGVLAAAVVISWGGPAANAFWQTLGSNAGTARADSIPAVAAPGASVSGGSASITWKQGTTAGGRPVAGYTVARYSAATGTKVAIGPGCAGKITALGCSEASLPPGTWYYTVTPVLGDNWMGVESAPSAGAVVGSAQLATPTITSPGIVNNAIADRVQVKGTATPGLSVKVTAMDAQGVQKVSQAALVNSAGEWTVSNFDLTALADGSITYTAVATNAAGNTSSAGKATTTKDTVAPTATVSLSNSGTNAPGVAETGDTVSIKYSGDINSSSICSAWGSGQQPSEITANNAVTVSINGNNLTVTTTGAAGCTVNIGPISLGGNYGTLTFKGNANAGPSKIGWSNATQTLTITLGARDGTAKTDVAESFPTVSPPAGVVDTSGNPAVGVTPGSPSRF